MTSFSCVALFLPRCYEKEMILFFFQMLKCIELDEKLKSMDQEITVNPQFVQKVRQRCFYHIQDGSELRFGFPGGQR